MSRFTIVWSQQAVDQLAAIWLVASDRDQITAMVANVDALLSRDPAGIGQPLHEGIMVMLYGNIRCLYMIRDADRLVDVLVVTRHA